MRAAPRPSTTTRSECASSCPLLRSRARLIPFEFAYVLDACHFPQPPYFRRRELQPPAPGQEPLDYRCRLLLRERRVLRVHELNHVRARRRGEHRHLAVPHPRELRQLRERDFLGG